MDDYTFCRSSDGTLGRRRLLGTIVVCGEVHVPSLDRWRLDDRVTSTSEWPSITEDEALCLTRSADALRAAFPDTADMAPHNSVGQAQRLDFLDTAITTTLHAVRSQEQSVANELAWASGDDLDYEMDMISWIKLAYRTLQSLFDEKQNLLDRAAWRRRQSHAD